MPLPDPTPENVTKVKGLLKSPDLDPSKRASMEKWLSDSLSHSGNEASPKAAQAQQEMASFNDDYSPVLAVSSASGKRSLFAEPEHAPANPKTEVQYWNEPSQAEARKAGVPYEEYADKKWQEARAAAEATGTPIIRDKYVVPTTVIGKAKKAARAVEREAPSYLDALTVGADQTVSAGLAHRGLADAAAKTGLDPGLPEQFDTAAEEHPGVAALGSALAFLPSGGGLTGFIAKKMGNLFGVGATAGKAASSLLPQLARGAGAGAATAVGQGTAEDAVKAADQAVRGQEVNALDDSLARDSVRAILGGGVGALAGAAGARAAQHRDSQYTPEATDINQLESAGGKMAFFSPGGVKAPKAAEEIYDLANKGGAGIPAGSHPDEVAAKLAEPFVSKGADDYLARTEAQGKKLVEQYLGSSASEHQVQPKSFLKALQGIFKSRTFDEDQGATPYTNSGEFKSAINKLAHVSRPLSDVDAAAAVKAEPGAIKLTLQEARKLGFDVGPQEVNGTGVPVNPVIPKAPPLPNIPFAGPKPGDTMASWLQARMQGPGGEAPTMPPPPAPPPESVRTAAATDRSPPIQATSMPPPIDAALAARPTTPSPGAPPPEGSNYVVITPRRLTPAKFEEVVHGIDKAAKAASKTASPDKAHALIQKAIREDRDQFPWPQELGPEPTAKISERDADGVSREVTVKGWSALHTLHHQALDEAEKALAATGLTPETAGTGAGSRAVKNSLMGRGSKGSIEAKVAQDALVTSPEGRQALANLDILNATQRLRGKVSPMGGEMRRLRAADLRLDPLYQWIASRAGPAAEGMAASVAQEPPKDDRETVKALLQSYGVGAR